MTPELEALSVLAARVEALTGPDRGVDAAIAALCRAGLPAGCDWAFKFPKWEGEQFGQVRLIGNVNGNGDYISGRFVSPTYTASLDAAMTLVPEDWNVSLRGCNDSWHVAMNATNFGLLRQSFGFARSASLALTAAALRARTPTQNHKGPHDE